ncbi:MAG TPA: hypothetical protein VJZ76_16795 [Thermoanaerobaculia bacterium]|nr:hypothetical protein [Thermoanaerobaculia bacterium]
MRIALPAEPEPFSPPNPSSQATAPPLRVIEHETVRIVERTAEAGEAKIPSPRHRYDEEPPRIVRGDDVHTVERERIREVRATPPRIIARETLRRAAALAAAAAPAESEPAIHVSIGRVEVRAVTAPVSAASERAPRRPMSIEQYAARQKERR